MLDVAQAAMLRQNVALQVQTAGGETQTHTLALGQLPQGVADDKTFDAIGLQLQPPPAVVGGLSTGGAAALAGLRKDDRIIAINNRHVASFADLVKLVPELAALLEDPAALVLFGDEAGFEGDPRPRQKWVKRGSRPVQGYHGGHLRRSVIGAVAPATGQLVSLLVPHCNTEVFQVFLDTVAAEMPGEQGQTIHLVLDNSSTHKTPSIQRWLNSHPRFTLHFTPTYASWLNLVERWFAELTTKWIKRGTHRSVRDLVASIRTWITNWNDDPRPFVWHKSADEILDGLAAYCQRINDSGH